jgi:hypothetical protein
VIGMFVVTNRRVFFLSSGRSGGFAIVSEAAMIERIAKSLDMRALQRTGSWDFTATELQSVEAARRPFLRGTCLRVIGCDKYGNNVCHQVYRPAVWRKTWEFVAAEINEVRQNVSLEVVGIEAKSS